MRMAPGGSGPGSGWLRARGQRQAELHESARQRVRSVFGAHAFVRGVVEVSNYCREDCAYCGMRRSHQGLARFRFDPEALADVLLEHRPAVITDLNIQTGEDPVAVREVVVPLIRRLRRETNLGISVCLGTLDAATYAALREAGASIYIMKFEMANPAHYARLRAPGTLEERLRHIRLLAGSGWRVSSGFIAGLPGETEADLESSLDLATRLPLDGCSVSPFIPGNESGLGEAQAGDVEETLNAMAILRLRQPDWVIPAVSALNLTAPENGYRRGLEAGANLVTVNLTPEFQRRDYLLYRRERTIMTLERVMAALEAARLEPSPVGLATHYATAPRESLLVSSGSADAAGVAPMMAG